MKGRGASSWHRTKAVHAHISSCRLLKVFGKECIYGSGKKKKKRAVLSSQKLCNMLGFYMALPSRMYFPWGFIRGSLNPSMISNELMIIGTSERAKGNSGVERKHLQCDSVKSRWIEAAVTQPRKLPVQGWDRPREGSALLPGEDRKSNLVPVGEKKQGQAEPSGV